jgi:predicted dienelactone hydrolase
VDSSRHDVIDTAQYRTLPVWVWYPADKDAAAAPGYPLPEKWRQEQGLYLDNKIGKGGSRFLQGLKVWAVADAPVASGSQKFPVLVFGPGYTWLPTDYSSIIEELTSSGYIVVGFVPTGFASFTQLASGTMIECTLPVQQQDIVFADALFVRKHLYTLQEGWLKGRIDTNDVGIFGHSQGGAAATVGMLTATGKMDREGRERSEYRRHSDWVRATDEAKVSLRVRITDIRHLNFNDIALVPEGQMTAEERKNKIGMVNGAETLKTIAAITRSFFDAYLKEYSFPSMVELEKEYPQVQPLLWKGHPYVPKENSIHEAKIE